MRLEDVRRAREVVGKAARHTPLIPSRTFSEMTGHQVFLKAENLQRTGSFKVRGAYNRIAQLSQAERQRGVIAASAGNHAQGVALAARETGIPCTIVMPKEASFAKVEATRGYGARVILSGDDFGQANEEALRRAEAEGSVFIPAFNDPAIMAGQGTIGLELLDDLPNLDVIVVPVGGGGLISGIALAAKESRPSVIVIGVQAEAATGAYDAFHSGERVTSPPRTTLADGIAVPQVGDQTLPLLLKYVDSIVTVTEDEIAHAVVLLLERSKLLVEGAGAASLAAVLGRKVPSGGQKVVALLSGGNMDLTLLAQVLDHGLAHAGRYMTLRVQLVDRPGRLAHLLECLAETGVNILEIDHHRTLLHLPVGQVEVELTAEARGPEHIDEIVNHLKGCGYALRIDGASVRAGGSFAFAAEETGRFENS